MIRGNRKKCNLYDDSINVEKKSPADVETTGPETINGIITNSSFVNVRKEANFESEVIEVLRRGDKVTILGKEGDFYKVSINNNKIAYISSEFINKE